MGIFKSLERSGAGSYFTGYFTDDFMATKDGLIQAERILHSAFPGGEIVVADDGSFTVDGPRSFDDDRRRLPWESLASEQLTEHMRTLELDIVRRCGPARTEFTLAFLLRRKVTDADLEIILGLKGVALASISPEPAHKGHILLVVADEHITTMDIRLALTLPSVH